MIELSTEKNLETFPAGKRGIATSWHSDLKISPKKGDEIVLPTVWGRCRFTVVSVEDDVALLESGEEMSRLKRQEDGTWRYPNYTWKKGMTVKATIVNSLPSRPNSNIGFTKKY